VGFFRASKFKTDRLNRLPKSQIAQPLLAVWLLQHLKRHTAKSGCATYAVPCPWLSELAQLRDL